MTAAALVVFGICLPLTAGVWRWFGILQQSEVLAYKAAKYREQAEATAKQAHEIQAALTNRVASVELALGAAVDQINTRLARVESGRVVLERKSA